MSESRDTHSEEDPTEAHRTAAAADLAGGERPASWLAEDSREETPAESDLEPAATDPGEAPGAVAIDSPPIAPPVAAPVPVVDDDDDTGVADHAQAKVADVTSSVTSTTDERPELLVLGAFAGGLLLAIILRRLGR